MPFVEKVEDLDISGSSQNLKLEESRSQHPGLRKRKKGAVEV